MVALDSTGDLCEEVTVIRGSTVRLLKHTEICIFCMLFLDKSVDISSEFLNYKCKQKCQH